MLFIKEYKKIYNTIDKHTMPKMMNEIFRSVAAERAVWVLFDANFC